MAKKKNQFTDVDVWQKEFGSVSVSAVFSIFKQRFNIEPQDMKKYSFSHCINALRKLEDPTYLSPEEKKELKTQEKRAA